MMDIMLRFMNIIERVRTVPAVSGAASAAFAVLLVFGVLNCILGYRLLRFWMVLFGFVIGSGIGLGGAFSLGVRERTVFIAAAVGVGIVLAVIVFLSYKAGIFVLGAGLGMSVAIYVLHPTSSLVFFLCILAGVLLGSLAMKWAREVIIVGTSLMGGAMAGVSAAKLGGLADIPYGILLSIGFALLGMLIQFATNRRRVEEDEDDLDYEEDEEEELRERRVSADGRKKKITRKEREYMAADVDDFDRTRDYSPRRRVRQSDEEIDEELLDEEILNEMMEEEDRKSDLMWEKISGRARRKKKDHGKRSED